MLLTKEEIAHYQQLADRRAEKILGDSSPRVFEVMPDSSGKGGFTDHYKDDRSSENYPLSGSYELLCPHGKGRQQKLKVRITSRIDGTTRLTHSEQANLAHFLRANWIDAKLERAELQRESRREKRRAKKC